MAGGRNVAASLDLVQSGWARTTWRSRCVRRAAADPDARLVLNEYDVEYQGAALRGATQGAGQLLRSLRDRDVPLHAVGLQAHLFAEPRHRPRRLAGVARGDRRAQARCTDYRTRRDRLRIARRGERARRAWSPAWPANSSERSVDVIRPKAILTWGLSDRYTWVPTYFKRRDGMPNRPLPLDADLKRKPLFDVIEEFRRKPLERSTR